MDRESSQGVGLRGSAKTAVYIAILTAFIAGCSTTAKHYTVEEDGIEKEVLEADRGTRAKFSDGSEIESEPLLKLPDVNLEIED